MAESEQPQNDQFQKYLEDFERRQQSRDASMAEIQRNQQAIAQHLAQQTQAAQAPKIAPVEQSKVDERLLREFFENPTRWVAELSEVQRNQSKQLVDQALLQYEQNRRTQDDYQQFWGGFVQHNQDLADFLPMVRAVFDQTPGQTASDRANTAAAKVRELVEAKRAAAVDEDRRTGQQARMTGSANGRGTPVRPAEEREVDAKQFFDEGIAELQEWKSKRMIYG
jgi:hypothetical protein